jgi:hypothetical protein
MMIGMKRRSGDGAPSRLWMEASNCGEQAFERSEHGLISGAHRGDFLDSIQDFAANLLKRPTCVTLLALPGGAVCARQTTAFSGRWHCIRVHGTMAQRPT